MFSRHRNAALFAIEALEYRRLLASSTFIYDQTPPYSAPHKLEFELDMPAVPSGAALNLINTTTSQTIDNATLSTGTWVGGASAIYTFPSFANGVLPDGNYYGLLVNASSDLQQSLGGANFFALTGDANHDRTVDTIDFSILAANFSQSGKKYSEGDFNYDSSVDTVDFSLLAAQFSKFLDVPAPAPATNLQAAFAATAINLDWNDSPESGVQYNVYRGADPEFIPEPEINRIASGLTASNFSDTAVVGSTRYYYRVTAVVAGQESGTNELGSEVTAVGQQPTDLVADAADEQRVEFSWADATSDETGYTVEAIDSNNNVVQSASLPANADSYVFSGLTEEMQYTLSVTATFNSPRPFQGGPTTTATTRAFDSMVGLILIINGHFQSLGGNTGMRTLANQLRAINLGGGLHYRVWRAAEYIFASGGTQINWDGTGDMYNQATTLLQTNAVQDVAIIGYSHGGAIVRRLAQRLINDRQLGQVWGMRYTAGIDAIERGFIDNWYPAFAERRLPNTEYHANFYNVEPFHIFRNPLKGNSVNGAQNYLIHDTHQTIQSDQLLVLDQIRDDIQLRVSA